jgi:phenylpyruvate tautomerase PptA (4-oxalocrotonate tautomerase family)
MNGTKRSCVILVPDGNMAAAFRGYLTRKNWNLSIGCAMFEFNPDLGGDLLVDGARDPGIYTRAHGLLRPYLRTHERALIAIDCEWGGSPGKDAIIQHITANLVTNGWSEESVKVIAIEPELDNWLWQDNPHVAKALGYRGTLPLRQLLEQEGLWLAGQGKPSRPKETADWVLRMARRPRSSAIYEELAGCISIRGCTDIAFHELRETLRTWFPPEATV